MTLSSQHSEEPGCEDTEDVTARLLAQPEVSRAPGSPGRHSELALSRMAHSSRRSVVQMSETSEPDLLPVSAMLQAKRALRVIHKIEQARGRRGTGEPDNPPTGRHSRISFASVSRQALSRLWTPGCCSTAS